MRPIRVMTWNVQYFAGRGYVFFYDLPDGTGPHSRPTAESVFRTLGQVAECIREVNPDILLLQEVDDGARRTGYEDQFARLLECLPDALRTEYGWMASTFYWRSVFVPHPRILGRVGMKLVTVSKFEIRDAVRLPLPRIPEPWWRRLFNLKRAVLDVTLPVAGGGSVHILNTHLDAFAQGTDTMARQVEALSSRVRELDALGVPWCLGGDFNLLPNEQAYYDLPEPQRWAFVPSSELIPFLNAYGSVPAMGEMRGADRASWYTYFSNDPRVTRPDRTLDYLFYSKGWALGPHAVLKEAISASDHLPVVAELSLR